MCVCMCVTFVFFCCCSPSEIPLMLSHRLYWKVRFYRHRHEILRCSTFDDVWHRFRAHDCQRRSVGGPLCLRPVHVRCQSSVPRVEAYVFSEPICDSHQLRAVLTIRIAGMRCGYCETWFERKRNIQPIEDTTKKSIT